MRNKKEKKHYQKLTDVFSKTQSNRQELEERKRKRLFWKDKNLDANTPIENLSVKDQAEYWSDLQAPFRIERDNPKPGNYPNDQSIPINKNYHEI
jgi:hypothetical protein